MAHKLNAFLIIVVVMPKIISGPSSVLIKNFEELPSFTCIAAGIPSPIIEWVLSDSSEAEMNLTNGEKYEITSTVSQMDDGSVLTNSTITFLTLSVNDTGLVGCKTFTSVNSVTNTSYVHAKQALLAILGMSIFVCYYF